MLTYELKKAPGVPLYEALYRCIRGDILSGTLAPGERLPSKRALAQNLEVSIITVETAYAQLLAEGYIRAQEKVGYFVEHQPQALTQPPIPAHEESAPEGKWLDLTGAGTEKFPFSVWSRLQREVMLDYGEKLLLPLPPQGIPELRMAIAEHLAGFRGMQVNPEQVIIGAGTDFLYNLLIQLLGRDKIYAVEDPGYGKIARIYEAGGVTCMAAPMDGRGVRVDSLDGARVLHISPAHHFPTGLVTPVDRRQELLAWARSRDGYIIEDDYDSEFRFDAHPKPTMQSLDHSGRVIYMNTFSKSLAPSIRISYMILPPDLLKAFREKLGFYSCTVSSFEQYTLARFLNRGYFEKHINRMRKYYKNRRNQVVSALSRCAFSNKLTIREEDAGLHFLLKVDTPMEDDELVRFCEKNGVRLRALSSYYHLPIPEEDQRCLVINYAGVNQQDLENVLAAWSSI